MKVGDSVTLFSAGDVSVTLERQSARKFVVRIVRPGGGPQEIYSSQARAEVAASGLWARVELTR